MSYDVRLSLSDESPSPAGKQGPPGKKGAKPPWRRDLERLRREPKFLWREHRRLTIALAVGAVAILAGIVVGYELLKRPPDVHNSDAAFKPQKPQKPKPRNTTVNWPLYGLNPARTRYLPAQGIKPPFRKLWR